MCIYIYFEILLLFTFDLRVCCLFQFEILETLVLLATTLCVLIFDFPQMPSVRGQSFLQSAPLNAITPHTLNHWSIT